MKVKVECNNGFESDREQINLDYPTPSGYHCGAGADFISLAIDGETCKCRGANWPGKFPIGKIILIKK